MMDLISRQAAIEVTDAIWCATGDKNVAKVWNQLKDLPSAQPEIIYCKDCRWKYTDYCTRAVDIPIDDDKYCAWAERRTTNENH